MDVKQANVLIKQLSDTLNLIKALERKERKAGRSKAERRKDLREALLPLNRVCSGCGQVKLRSKQWVCTGPAPLCLSCSRLGVSTMPTSSDDHAED